jgi:O-antigen/teichoic acid export membrane protein
VRRLAYTVVKNALANIVRGGASAMAALVIPHFLSRSLDHNQFAAWVLMLQIAAYANYFDFGLQTALARYLAQAIEEQDTARRDRLISTAFGLLIGAGTLAFAMFAAIIWQLPHLFHSIPAGSVADLRVGLIVMAASAAVGLPLSVFTGILIGLHRNEFPAVAIGTSRILGALAVVVAVHRTSSLGVLALCLATTNIAGMLAQYAFVRRLLPDVRFRLARFNSAMARELAKYCSTLTAWSLAMLLVTGLDVTIVGYFNFGSVGPYGLAATLVNFVVGLSGSVFMAMLTPVATLQTRGEYGRIVNLIFQSTRLNTYACTALTLAAFLCGPFFLRLWVGSGYASQALPILEILLAAQTVRLMAGAYSVVLVAIGEQRKGLLAGVVEGVLNLVLSVTGMVVMGAVGVAWATLVAAVAGVFAQVYFVMPSVKKIRFSRALFLRQSMIAPLVPFAPLIAWVGLRNRYIEWAHPSTLGVILPMAACLLVSTFMVAFAIYMDLSQNSVAQ